MILVEFPLSCLADLLKFSFLDKLWRREVKENERFRLAPCKKKEDWVAGSAHGNDSGQLSAHTTRVELASRYRSSRGCSCSISSAFCPAANQCLQTQTCSPCLSGLLLIISILSFSLSSLSLGYSDLPCSEDG